MLKVESNMCGVQVDVLHRDVHRKIGGVSYSLVIISLKEIYTF